MREAITQYVDREEKREAFRQDTLKAWEAFRSNGLHVTADEADAWMAQLEQGNDIEPPECQVTAANVHDLVPTGGGYCCCIYFVNIISSRSRSCPKKPCSP